MRLTTDTPTTSLVRFQPLPSDFDPSEVMPTFTVPARLARTLHLAIEDAERQADADAEQFRAAASNLRNGKRVGMFADGENGARAADRLAEEAEGRLNMLVELLDFMFEEDRFALVFK